MLREEEEIVGLSDDADFSRRGSDWSRLSCSYPGPGDSVDGAILSLGSEDLNARSSSSAKSCTDVSAGVDEDLYITLHLDPRLREARDALVVTTHAQARPQINALMLYHFIFDSLGTVPLKKASHQLDEVQQDGPLLLKIVLDDTFVATLSATFTTQEKFYELHLKKFRWNV